MKSKTTAALLAFFLGGLGAHRFYLGRTASGFLYLFFCWTFIPAFIAFIESILWLLMSEADFNLKYNANHLLFNQQRTQTAQPSIQINNVMNGHPPTAAPYPQQQQAPVQRTEPAPEHIAFSENRFKKEGIAQYGNYDFDKALESLRRAANISPRDGEIHFILANIYSILEQVEPAYAHLEQAVKLGHANESLIQTYDHLAYLRTHEGFEQFKRNGFCKEDSRQALLQTPRAQPDLIDQLEKLVRLRDQGVITDTEFSAQKVRLLG